MDGATVITSFTEYHIEVQPCDCVQPVEAGTRMRQSSAALAGPCSLSLDRRRLCSLSRPLQNLFQ